MKTRNYNEIPESVVNFCLHCLGSAPANAKVDEHNYLTLTCTVCGEEELTPLEEHNV